MIIKGNNLKDKIQEEIDKIDKLYEKVNNDITKSYEKKFNQLKIEENNLIEKLQNEVTKVKEKIRNIFI